MSDAYLGSILYFAGNFTIRNYLPCNGQALALSQYQALFAVIGTSFGGDARTTFNLPDLRGRAPLHVGQRSGGGPSYNIGQAAGSESVTLTTQQLPAHTHPFAPGPGTLTASVARADASTPDNGLMLARGTDGSSVGSTPQIYGPAATTDTVTLAGVNAAGTVGIAGSGQPVATLPPYLAVNALICVQGLFPSRN